MLLVIPVCAADLPLALLNLRLARRLDTACPFPCLVSAPAGLDVSELVSLASAWSTQALQFCYDDWRGDPAWPRPQNWAWQQTARHVATLAPPRPWLWWEADATPLRSSWLHTLADAYDHDGAARPFAGHVAADGHLNGVAIYPADVRPFSSAAFLARSAPFDRVLSQDIMPRLVTPLNGLIGHYLKPPGRASAPLASRADVDALLATGAVLYHGSSDGTLVRFLLGVETLPTVAPPPPSRTADHILSVMRQTEWPAALFKLPPTLNTVYFNCSLCEHAGALHLFARRWRYNLRPTRSNTDNQSDLAIFRLDAQLAPAGPPRFPRLSVHPFEQWEDPRVTIGSDGRARASFASWVHKRPWKCRQIFTRLSRDWSHFDAVDSIAYGGNGLSASRGTAPEKNWTWFEHDGLWHCRYSINPSEVFSARDGHIESVWREPARTLPWQHSAMLRGGTPPVRVGSEYISFFHSHLPWGARRRYFMGAFAFAATPPFALTRMVRLPLLSGSEQDPMTLPSALPCVFPNGALLRDNEWLVTFGVNDEACGWIRIPHSALDALLEPIARKTLFSRLTAALTV